MPDSIHIKGLKVDARIGVYDWEQQVGQTLLIDLELRYNMRKAAASDSLELAVDYDALSQRVRQHVQQSRLQLLEALAEQIAALCLAEFAIESCRITVHKPTALERVDDLAISIERP